MNSARALSAILISCLSNVMLVLPRQWSAGIYLSILAPDRSRDVRDVKLLRLTLANRSTEMLETT